MTFMPNPTTHAVAQDALGKQDAPPGMGAIPRTNTANNVGGQVAIPATSTQGSTAPPQALHDPSLGSNPGAANNGAGLSPVLTGTAFGTNDIPQFLNSGLNQLNSNFSNQSQWMDLIGKIVGGMAGNQQSAPEPQRTAADDAAYWSGHYYDKAFNASQPSYGGGLWGTSTKRQLLDQSQFYGNLATSLTPRTVSYNNDTTNLTTNNNTGGWGPRMPSF